MIESALRNLGCTVAEARQAVAWGRQQIPETEATDAPALEALLRASLPAIKVSVRRFG